MTFLVIANFKSNKTQNEVKEWINSVHPSPHMVIAPSFPHLAQIHDIKPNFALCAQDVSPFPPGSYTGAVSAVQLKDLSVSYAIVGHSERRRYFHETASDVAAKVKELLAHDITPIVCMEQKDIASTFSALDDEYYEKCIFCFEPSEDIGGTTIASLDSILEFKAMIEKYVTNPSFMYGGSVNADNISDLLKIGLSGVLVATASLKSSSFNDILSLLS